MRKAFFILIAAVMAGKYGFDYLLSEKFQKFGDEKKAVWTCHVNNFLGNSYIMVTNYPRALEMFSRSLARCPEGSTAEEAEFKIGECYENTGRQRDALSLYLAYVEKYPGTKRAKLADKSVQVLR